jgi:hypothetical protein
MIKVIKPAKAEYNCTCPFCTAILEFREEDIEHDEYYWEYIKCPECKGQIGFNKFNLIKE